eukprot:gnl/Dysnectes_brevis/2322_a2737_1675.p1 GENE.gnl/Dysnectes_brevis/2322_a2737_1675~~gnl/Dysnectes_brevis/2322_a2737_1675.p1  ORF type:complete len:339 (+),score=35.11 gnl/Dysnectes_brevis/2322_a2737_1675:36-1052(+)
MTLCLFILSALLIQLAFADFYDNYRIKFEDYIKTIESDDLTMVVTINDSQYNLEISDIELFIFEIEQFDVDFTYSKFKSHVTSHSEAPVFQSDWKLSSTSYPYSSDSGWVDMTFNDLSLDATSQLQYNATHMIFQDAMSPVVADYSSFTAEVKGISAFRDEVAAIIQQAIPPVFIPEMEAHLFAMLTEWGPLGPLGCLGALGPLSKFGPLGEQPAASPLGPDGPLYELGPLGSTGPLGALDSGVRSQLDQLGAYGPLGLLGPLGPLGALGGLGPLGALGPLGPVEFWEHIEVVGEEIERNDWMYGPLSVFGPLGVLGALGPLGPLGPVGPMGPLGPYH